MQFTNARMFKKEIRKLYRTAFPANERAPLFLLFKRTDNGRDNFYAITDNNEFIGLLYTISYKNLTYIFFLAVEKNKRGKGYGTKILKKVKEMNPDKTVILMIEDTKIKDSKNYKERIERLKFYERNGFVKLDIDINEAGVDYELLGTFNDVSKSDFLDLMKDYVGSFLFKILYKRTKI